MKIRFKLVRVANGPPGAAAVRRKLPWLKVARLPGSLRGLIDPAASTKTESTVVLFVLLPGVHGIWYW
jgi:hypothetical protein